MALFKLDLRPLYGRAMGTSSPHRTLAGSISRWLNRVAGTLEDRGYCFESGAAEDLAEQFRKFADGAGDNDDLSLLWNDLVELGETSITTISGREKALCDIPNLPDSLSC